MSIEAAAQRMNDLGWTCTAHEPFHFSDCTVCHANQMDTADVMIAAYAGDRVFYEIPTPQEDWPLALDHMIEDGWVVQVFPEKEKT